MNQGVRWAAGLIASLGVCLAWPSVAAAQSGPPPDSEFEKVTLNDLPGEPMDLAVLPDGRVLHTTRPGELWLHNPETGRNTLAAAFNLYRHDEEGLQSVALDPNFAENNWVYLYYSPPLDTPVDDPVTPVNEGDAPFFGTEADWARYRGLSGCRASGSRARSSTCAASSRSSTCPSTAASAATSAATSCSTARGNLSCRPATTPTRSSPTATRRSTSARTATPRSTPSARRPTPTICGARSCASVPDSAAATRFRPGTCSRRERRSTRPEIYAMGLRNPFRIEHQPRQRRHLRRRLLAGQPQREPAARPGRPGQVDDHARAGQLRLAILRHRAAALRRLRLRNGRPGATFNCAAPVNESPHNTGLRELPPVTQPESGTRTRCRRSSRSSPRRRAASGRWPVPPTTSTAKAGPPAWPAYFDGVPLFYEWTRDYIKEFRLDDAGNLAEIRPAGGAFPGVSLLGNLGRQW